MNDQTVKKKAIVSWTGGKDCALSLLMAKQAGFEICALVTFIPAGSKFRAHPLEILEKQVEALNLPWTKIVIELPYPLFYELSLQKLKRKYDIDFLITGDIDFIDDFLTNYMEERCKAAGLKIFNPIWFKSREEIWDLLFENNFEIILSFTKAGRLGSEWTGKNINRNVFAEFKKAVELSGSDLCGENGEFHSIVVNSPNFDRKLKLNSLQIISDDEFNYLKIEDVSFLEKK